MGEEVKYQLRLTLSDPLPKWHAISPTIRVDRSPHATATPAQRGFEMPV